MEISGLHILLTYQCTYQCEHCFVWGSPWQTGTLSLEQIEDILAQAQAASSIEWIYFEGGEPFLYFPVLLNAVRMAAEKGFSVGLVTNAYWAKNERDAAEWLRPFVGLIADLSVSCDDFHQGEEDHTAVFAHAAARELGIPTGLISVARPQKDGLSAGRGQIPTGASSVMFRGRAAKQLAHLADMRPWQGFNTCPHEDLRDPGRVHLDPLGYLHICQGISIGNLFETPLTELLAAYDPDQHPICGPLLAGGPAELVKRYELPVSTAYADACHLCYESRLFLREKFPDILTPDQMYASE